MGVTQAFLDRDEYTVGLPPAAVQIGQSGVVAEPSNARMDLRGHARTCAEATVVREDVRSTMARNPERARAAALRLVALLTQTAEVEPVYAPSGLAPWQQRKVEQFVRDHLGSSMHLRDLARQASLSVSRFSRAFKKSFGDTPRTYIMRQRIRQAQKLMLTTREPLSQIALICGFADQAHLSNAFRREADESPGAWRRRNASDGRDAAASLPR